MIEILFYISIALYYYAKLFDHTEHNNLWTENQFSNIVILGLITIVARKNHDI